MSDQLLVLVVSEDSGRAAQGVFACQTTNWFWLFQRTVGELQKVFLHVRPLTGFGYFRGQWGSCRRCFCMSDH